MDERVPFGLWDLANDARLDGQGAWTNGLFVLEVNERTVTRAAEVFYDFDQEIDNAERIHQGRWQEYVGWDGTGEFPFWKLEWKRKILGMEFDQEATDREIEEMLDSESYISVTPLEHPQKYSL